jgi:hypothetical protein
MQAAGTAEAAVLEALLTGRRPKMAIAAVIEFGVEVREWI